MQVVAAVFEQAEKVLVCRRKIDLHNGGLWEFPGGKRKPDESFEHALAREVAEELHVRIHAGQLSGCSLGNYVHKTGSLEIELHCFMVLLWQGEFVPTDHDQIKWCAVEELRSMQLSAADVPFIDRIENYLQST